MTQETLARVADWFDRWIIAGLLVRGTHGTTELFGRALRLVQTGSLQTYAFLFAAGVVLDGVRTLPASVRRIDPPELLPRDPPVRFRKTVADCWIELEIVEGKNRQVRRMTAAVGHPTLRLLRTAIGDVRLGELAPGTFRAVSDDELAFARR